MPIDQRARWRSAIYDIADLARAGLSRKPFFIRVEIEKHEDIAHAIVAVSFPKFGSFLAAFDSGKVFRPAFKFVDSHHPSSPISCALMVMAAPFA
jgi:hypothetical protein